MPTSRLSNSTNAYEIPVLVFEGLSSVEDEEDRDMSDYLEEQDPDVDFDNED